MRPESSLLRPAHPSSACAALTTTALVAGLLFAACGTEGANFTESLDVVSLDTQEGSNDATVPDTSVGDDTATADVATNGDSTSPEDGAAQDTAPADDAATPDDVTVADTTPDDVTAADTTPDDATAADTTPDDATAADTTPDDATAADTTPADVTTTDAITSDDASGADTSVVDSGVPADTGDPSDTGVTTDAGADVADATDTGVDALDAVDADAGPIVEPPMPTGPVVGLVGPPYLMWVTEDAVSVRWETTGSFVGRVEYGPTRALGMVATETASRTSHEVRLTGLRPGEVTYYRVLWSDTGVPTRQFRTAPPRDEIEPFRFVVWGDNQNGPSVFREVVDGMRDADPAFAIVAGDCVQNGTRGEYREQLFQPLAGFADQVPFLVGAGNHERYSDSSATLFNEYLSQPGDEHCFGWRWGMMYIVFVDTELGLRPGESQYVCIQNALSSVEAQTATYQAAIFHKPPRINFWFGGMLAFPDSMEEPDVREFIEPLLESYNVDIVFNGHNHLYAHSPETAGGIVWVTTGGGGGSLDTNNFLWRVNRYTEIQTTVHEHHFLTVDVDNDVMIVRAINRAGAEIHSFEVYPD